MPALLTGPLVPFAGAGAAARCRRICASAGLSGSRPMLTTRLTSLDRTITTRGLIMKVSALVGSFALLGLAFLLPARAYAGIEAPPEVTVGVSMTPEGSGFDWDYRVTLVNADVAPSIGAIEIPEVQAGFLTAPNLLPSGWTAEELSSPVFGDPKLKPDGNSRRLDPAQFREPPRLYRHFEQSAGLQPLLGFQPCRARGCKHRFRQQRHLLCCDHG